MQNLLRSERPSRRDALLLAAVDQPVRVQRAHPIRYDVVQQLQVGELIELRKRAVDQLRQANHLQEPVRVLHSTAAHPYPTAACLIDRDWPGDFVHVERAGDRAAID